jgi:hypothetical protein
MADDELPGTAAEAKCMAKKVTILRSSLLSLALAAAIPAAWAADATPGLNIPVQNSDSPPTPKMLNLKAPDIHAVMSSEQIAAAIPNPDDTEVMEPETVQVHGGGAPAPYVPGGFAALYWAALHPSEAWRIVTPVL